MAVHLTYWGNMQRIETQRRKAYILRLAIIQLLVTLMAMLLAYSSTQLAGVPSVLKGALVALLPHAFFVYRMGFLHTNVSQRSAMLLRAEAGKFGLTVALFTAVFVAVPPSNPAFFFSAYVAIVLTHWLAPLLMLRHRATN